jgi:hypothetical protein
MLPVYHRQGDAKLLLLTVPACAIMWCRGGSIGKLALAVTASGLVLTAEIPWAILLTILRHLQMPPSHWATLVLIGIQVFPIPLVLICMSLFYLWLPSRIEPSAAGMNACESSEAILGGHL